MADADRRCLRLLHHVLAHVFAGGFARSPMLAAAQLDFAAKETLDDRHLPHRRIASPPLGAGSRSPRPSTPRRTARPTSPNLMSRLRMPRSYLLSSDRRCCADELGLDALSRVLRPSGSRARAAGGCRPATRPELLACSASPGILNLWGLSINGWANTYYSAAVRSMTTSWHDFLFASLDKSGLMTVDKPPLACGSRRCRRGCSAFTR